MYIFRESEKLDCTTVIQKIKNRVLNPEARLRAVFTKINAVCIYF